MSKIQNIFVVTGKIGLIGVLFFASFGVTVGAYVLSATIFPGFHFIVYILPAFPIMWCANRFLLSPVQYRLGIKTMQYDPWYEQHIQRKKGLTKESS